jgi:hypothetical protein
VNPISAVTWSWRTLRGHSITFATLFGFGVLGISAISTLRLWLSRGGAPWYLWLVAPTVLITVVAKKETQWVPNLEERKKWARRVFFSSIVLAIVLAIFRPAPPVETAPPRPKSEPFHKIPR